MEDGVYGELESTMPPVTCPAWPCMFTGKNPGKLGMYYFIDSSISEKGQNKLSDSSYYHRWSLWKILNDHKISVGLFNVAMTYPPHKVDSFMVCGIGSPPSARANYTYPASLKSTLEKIVPGYEPVPLVDMTIAGKENIYRAALIREVDNRTKAAKYLMNRFPWQLFVNVFFATDTAQHYFWHHMDKEHPKYKAGKYHDVIKEIYKKVDTSIGELIKELPEKTNIIVVSDHGFGPEHKCFAEDRWLEEQGLLTLTSTITSGVPLLWRIRGILLSILGVRITKWIAKIIPERFSEKISSRSREGAKVNRLYNNIDWAKTKAFPQAGMGCIRVNLKGRESTGIVNPGEEYERLVDDIVYRLRQLNDPISGEPIGINVFKGKEMYHGNYAAQGPDVVFHMDKYLPVPSEGHNLVWDEPRRSGWHARHGVFIANGPDIKNSGEKLADLKIYDITPTILHMFGLPVPDDIDGRVLTEIFKPDSEPAMKQVNYRATGKKQKVRNKIGKLRSSGII